MSPDRVLDVCCTFDAAALALEPDPIRAVAETCRQAAETQCAELGATLRHPDPRQIESRQAIDPLTGNRVVLVATRWIADGGRQP